MSRTLRILWLRQALEFWVHAARTSLTRYSSDAAAVEAICRSAAADVVIAPATSRLLRVMPGVSHRLNGQVDTHITAIEINDGIVSAKRWFYRQRLEAMIQRDARGWFLVMDSGCHAAWTGAPGA